jgi:hypothetical protein
MASDRLEKIMINIDKQSKALWYVNELLAYDELDESEVHRVLEILTTARHALTAIMFELPSEIRSADSPQKTCDSETCTCEKEAAPAEDTSSIFKAMDEREKLFKSMNPPVIPQGSHAAFPLSEELRNIIHEDDSTDEFMSPRELRRKIQEIRQLVYIEKGSPLVKQWTSQQIIKDGRDELEN